MFHYEGFVEDKNLARLHHAINGIVLQIKVRPVPEESAQVKGGKIVVAADASAISMFWKYAQKKQLKVFTAADMRKFVSTVLGLKEAAYFHFLKKLRDAGAVRKVGKGTSSKYEIIEKKEPA